MILKNEIKLKTPILGCKLSPSRPRQLLRDVMGKPGLVEIVWQRHFKSAAQDLDIEYQSDMIVFPTGIDADKFEEHLRQYSKFQRERFESIPVDAQVTFEVMLMEDRLAPSDYARILSVVGERYGVSQFGNRFGYGRFDIVTIKRERLSVNLDFNLDI